MRILLVGNYEPDRQQSMLRFAALMLREINARGHHATLIQPEPHFTRLVPASGAVAKWLGYLDKFLLFPRRLKREKKSFDLVHLCDHSNAIYAKYLLDTPNLVTCHDVLAIRSALGEVAENPVSTTGRKLQAMILNGLKQARHIVCVSQNTRTEMLRVTARPAATSEVIYLSLNYPYAPMPHDQAFTSLDALGFDARTPFFLHVGANLWYKNRLAVLRLFHLLRQRPGYQSARLVFVGDPFDGPMEAFLREHQFDAHVTRLSGISNEDLCAVYSLAIALLFPSLQEGFGWPVLEAQACGCPVFTTGRPPMTELGAAAAVYFDPADLASAADIVTRALENRTALCAAGLENVRRFTVDNMIDAYLKAYDSLTPLETKLPL